jgi:hypothetical protein
MSIFSEHYIGYIPLQLYQEAGSVQTNDNREDSMNWQEVLKTSESTKEEWDEDYL